MAGSAGADTNGVKVAFFEESTFAEVPGTAPTLQEVNFTAESLQGTTEKVLSSTVRFDRRVRGSRTVAVGASGDVNAELEYGGHDAFWEAAFGAAAFTSPVTVGPATTISFESIATSATTNPKVLDSGSGFGSIAAYEWIRVSGAATSGNNQVMQVLVASAGELEVRPLSGDLTDETAGASVTVSQGGSIVDSTNCRSFGVEREHTDVASLFARFLGLVPGGAQVRLVPGSLNSVVFSFLGALEVSGVTATMGDGSNTAASTNDPTDPVNDITAILEDGSSTELAEFQLALNANLRQKRVLGLARPKAIGLGQNSFSGSLRAFLSDGTRRDAHLGDTARAFAVVITDPAGNTIVFDFPRAKYQSRSAATPGANQDVVEELAYQVENDPTQGVQARMVRIAA